MSEPIAHQAVDSSNVESFGYDEPSRVLEVRFKGGATYRYHGVEPETHAWLRDEAPSIGSAIHQHIKPHHDCERVA